MFSIILNILLFGTFLTLLYGSPGSPGNYLTSNRRRSTIEDHCAAVNGTNSDIDRRLDKKSIRLMQYNVEWLFTEYYQPADCPGQGCPWNNDTAAHTHIQSVAKVVNEVNPDILSLCEIQGCDELEELISYLSYKDQYRRYVVQGDDTATGQNVGIITKVDPSIGQLRRSDMRISYPLPDSKCGYEGKGGTTLVSKNYVTEFTFGNMEVVLVGAHFLAVPTDPERCAKREAQAAIIREIVVEYIRKEYEIIVMGDFNDYDSEILDINNHIPTSRVLNIVKYGTNFESNEESRSAFSDYLVSCEELVQKSERYSLWWDENGDGKVESSEYAMIDYVLVSPNLFSLVEKVEVYHGYDEGLNIYDSDHYPIIVDINLM